MGTVFEARLCIPPSFVHEAKKDLVALCGEPVGHRGQQASGQPYNILEGIITDPSLIGQAKQLQTEWKAKLSGQGDHLGFSLLELLQLYFYRLDVRRGQNIYEEGEHFQILDEPRTTGPYNDTHYDMDVHSLCTFYGHLYDGRSFQLFPDDEWYGSQDLLSEIPSFLVKEAAVFLNISEQRVLQLIPAQLSAKKRGGRWLVSGKDLVTFAGKVRTNGRPVQTKTGPQN